MKFWGTLLILILVGHNLSAQVDDAFICIIDPQPEFPGGLEEMHKFLSDNIQYPQESFDNAIQGKVFVRFTIDSTGDIKNTQIVKSVHPLIDQEAKRVIEMMPCWTPGTQRGKKVNTQYTLPITFSLN